MLPNSFWTTKATLWPAPPPCPQQRTTKWGRVFRESSCCLWTLSAVWGIAIRSYATHILERTRSRTQVSFPLCSVWFKQCCWLYLLPRKLRSLVMVKERHLKHSTLVLQWTWDLLQAPCARIICPHIRRLWKAKARVQFWCLEGLLGTQMNIKLKQCVKHWEYIPGISTQLIYSSASALSLTAVHSYGPKHQQGQYSKAAGGKDFYHHNYQILQEHLFQYSLQYPHRTLSFSAATQYWGWFLECVVVIVYSACITGALSWTASSNTFHADQAVFDSKNGQKFFLLHWRRMLHVIIQILVTQVCQLNQIVIGNSIFFTIF